MRTVVETEVIPPDPNPTIVKTSWLVCEAPGCSFRTQDEDDAKEHHARTHALRRRISTSVGDLYWFDSEGDAKAWLDVEHGDFCRMREVQWSGADWYAIRTWTQPCPRGCCEDSCVRLEPAGYWITDSIDRARSIMRGVAEVKQAIREAEHG